MRTACLTACLAVLAACSTHDVPEAPTTSVRVVGSSVELSAADRSGSGIAGVRYRLDGGAWRDYGAAPTPILDSTAASFARWLHAGPGGFLRNADGSVQTDGGLGMLWYPRAFGDIALRLQWRDVGGGSNSGVLVRFPDPRADAQPEWFAIRHGHEVQINDGRTDPQKTGSVYGFAPVTSVAPHAGWEQLEIRITGGPSYRVVVLRDGKVVTNWVNRPGQQATRAGDPPTDERQVASGYVGLQNHGPDDVIAYRDVTVTDLRPQAGAVPVTRGRHVIEVSARDWAGHAEPARRVTFTVS
jgi:hypothetical protein